MSSIPFQPPRRSFDFGNTVSGFLDHSGLPFSNILSAERIGNIFRKHDGILAARRLAVAGI